MPDTSRHKRVRRNLIHNIRQLPERERAVFIGISLMGSSTVDVAYANNIPLSQIYTIHEETQRRLGIL